MIPLWLQWTVFAIGPIVLAIGLRHRTRPSRRIRTRQALGYVVILTAIITAAVWIASLLAKARFTIVEILFIVWFTIGWRLAWEVWRRIIDKIGPRWIRLGRMRRVQKRWKPCPTRLVRIARGLLTLFVFVPMFVSCTLIHRVKLIDGQTPDVFNLDYETVKIKTADGNVVDAWWIPEKGADRTILICHGAGANKGNFIWYLGPLCYNNYNMILFDFRAHGSTTGRTTTYGINERFEVLAVVDWLKQEHPAESKKIVGIGSSLGSLALALAAAEDDRIDAVILDSPLLSPREFAQHHAKRLPGPIWTPIIDLVLLEMSFQSGADFFDDKWSAEQAVRQFGDRPVMVIHGSDDFLMPAEHAQRIYDAAQGPCEIWFGPGSHSNIVTTVPEEYERRLFAFLNKYLPRPQTSTTASH